jgi:hypothetical protein
MALTKATQRYIYQKQNPTRCEEQKYLILNKFPGDDAFGIGAIVQRISDYLSIAIQTNSILLYSEDLSPGEHFIQDPTDGGDKSCGRSFDCIFQKLSKCQSKSQRGMERNVQSVFDMPAHGSGADVDPEAYLAKHGTQIPPVFEAALKLVQPDITGEMLKYWWRAQATGYIMRLNNKASSRMKELRLGKDTEQLGIQWDVSGRPQEVDLPFPMPEGTISMHVRHGDKGLVDVERYQILDSLINSTTDPRCALYHLMITLFERKSSLQKTLWGRGSVLSCPQKTPTSLSR